MREKKLNEELQKEQVDKESWKNTFVPAYFQSEWGKNFLEGVPNKESNFLQTSENEFTHNAEDNSLINLKKQAQVKLKIDEPPKDDSNEEKKKKNPKAKDKNQENKGGYHSRSNVSFESF